MVRRLFGVFSLVSLVLALSLPVHAQGQYPRWAGGGLQIRGYDTTAYFKAGQATRGQAGNQVKWNGGTWHFRSAKDAAAFKASPARFTPRFGAYCTGGLSQQHVVNGNPTIWRMHKGRLYLFYAQAGARRFDRNPEGVIAAARAYAKTVGIKEN